MRHVATLFLLTLLAGSTAFAQPDRRGEDVIWVRDVGEAEMTLDGALSEGVWANAETISLVWDGDHPLPGGGQFIEGNPALADPSDPVNATVHFLRKGNVVWFGVEADDASIGGTRDLWALDGIIMSMVNRNNRPDDFEALEDPNYFGGAAGFGNVRSEFIYGWVNRVDTTATGEPLPGVGPSAFSSNFGPGLFSGVDDEPTEDAWGYAATVSGVSNDDNNETGSPTPDEGYVMEFFIDLEAMGYDFEQAGGDKAPFSFSVADIDYRWPLDEASFFRSRVYWQFGYANNYNTGVGYLMGAPGVTVESGETPEVTEPEYVIADASDEGAITLDGALDEGAWEAVPYTFYMQYKPEITLLDANPGPLVSYYSFYYRPDINGDGNAAQVVDRTVGQFKMLHQGSMLYVGLDTDDAAISGIQGEDGRDGFRLAIRSLDSLNTSGTGGGALRGLSFEFQIDSTGALTYAGGVDDYVERFPGSIEGAVHLKGESTAADPSDVDTGYQMEVAIDLTALGYAEDLSDERRVWTHLTFFDGDYLDVPANSYATRVWQIGERAEGASLYGYLEEGEVVANEGDSATPGALALAGNHPNPFAARTVLRYSLPHSGEVEVAVYDVLGRRVALVKPGAQAAGPNAVTVEADGLASGLYFYRIQLKGSDVSATGRMTVVK